MDTSAFPRSAQEGHPHTESAGSTSAAGAEGYVTVWQLYFLRGGRSVASFINVQLLRY